jgi:hypothetical protein
MEYSSTSICFVSSMLFECYFTEYRRRFFFLLVTVVRLILTKIRFVVKALSLSRRLAKRVMNTMADERHSAED